jgi:hypothetical protein
MLMLCILPICVLVPMAVAWIVIGPWAWTMVLMPINITKIELVRQLRRSFFISYVSFAFS